MQQCLRCGDRVAPLMIVCEACSPATEDEIRRYDAALDRNYRNSEVDRIANGAASSIELGRRLYLYDQMYIPVDSEIPGERTEKPFDIGKLRTLGLNGWEIVASIPRTKGIALQNHSLGISTGTTWGAGLGGNVVGVYLVLRKEIPENRTDADEAELQAYVNAHIVR